MTKAVISNRIYLTEPEEGFADIKKSLTYKIETRKPDRSNKMIMSVEILRTYKQLPRNILSIPLGRKDLIPEGCEIIDKRVYNEMPFPEPKFPLRPEQQVVFDEINDGCILNALVGWGKCFALPLSN